MNYSETWNELIEVLFRNKKGIISELSKDSSIVDFDQNRKTLYITVKKQYLETVLKSNIEQIKALFERMTQKPVSLVSINNKIYNIQIIKKLDPKESMMLDESEAVSAPIAYQSYEQSFDDAIFIKQSEIEERVKARTVNLDFYNKMLQDSRTLIFHKADAEYKKYYILSAITLLTVIPSIVFLVIARNKQKKIKDLIRKIDELLVLKYRATNYYAKDFIKNL